MKRWPPGMSLQFRVASPNTLDAICFKCSWFAYTSNFLSEILSLFFIKSASTAKDSLNGTAFAVLVHLGLVIKVDQLDAIERPNIESYRFKTIRRIMDTMKSLYLYNNFIVWRFRDLLGINDFLPPRLSAFTIVFLNSRSSWMIQKP